VDACVFGIGTGGTVRFKKLLNLLFLNLAKIFKNFDFS
jgi:hypothetical protein